MGFEIPGRMIISCVVIQLTVSVIPAISAFISSRSVMRRSSTFTHLSVPRTRTLSKDPHSSNTSCLAYSYAIRTGTGKFGHNTVGAMNSSPPISNGTVHVPITLDFTSMSAMLRCMSLVLTISILGGN